MDYLSVGERVDRLVAGWVEKLAAQRVVHLVVMKGCWLVGQSAK